MKKGKYALVKLLCLSSILFVCSASAKNFEAKICYDCTKSEAKTLALSEDFTASHTCENDHSAGNAKSCNSKPKHVLVANSKTGQIWGFQVSIKAGSLSARPIDVSDSAFELMTYVVSSYAKLNSVITSVNQALDDQVKFANITSLAPSSTTRLSENCGDYPHLVQAVGASFDPRTIGAYQDLIQSAYSKTYPDENSTLAKRELRSSSFSVSNGDVDINGTWENHSGTIPLHAEFSQNMPSSSDTMPPKNAIAYNVSMNNDTIGLEVNNSLSRINGNAISALKKGRLLDTNACLLERLNQYLEVSIQSDPSDGSYQEGEGAIDFGTGLGFIPKFHETDDTPKSCTWRFFTPQGDVAFVMQGPCP
jgi:hypothetical protein